MSRLQTRGDVASADWWRGRVYRPGEMSRLQTGGDVGQKKKPKSLKTFYMLNWQINNVRIEIIILCLLSYYKDTNILGT